MADADDEVVDNDLRFDDAGTAQSAAAAVDSYQ